MISMAKIVQIVNVLQSPILTKGKEMVKTPTYYIFKMYNVHQDANLIPLELSTENYSFEGESIPAITASASEKYGVISVTITNANPNKTIAINCSLNRDLKVSDAQILTSKNYTDYNDLGKEEKVGISDFEIEKVRNKQLTINVPAHTALLLQLQ